MSSVIGITIYLVHIIKYYNKFKILVSTKIFLYDDIFSYSSISLPHLALLDSLYSRDNRIQTIKMRGRKPDRCIQELHLLFCLPSTIFLTIWAKLLQISLILSNPWEKWYLNLLPWEHLFKKKNYVLSFVFLWGKKKRKKNQ